MERRPGSGGVPRTQGRPDPGQGGHQGACLQKALEGAGDVAVDLGLVLQVDQATGSLELFYLVAVGAHGRPDREAAEQEAREKESLPLEAEKQAWELPSAIHGASFRAGCGGGGGGRGGRPAQRQTGLVHRLPEVAVPPAHPTQRLEASPTAPRENGPTGRDGGGWGRGTLRPVPGRPLVAEQIQGPQEPRRRRRGAGPPRDTSPAGLGIGSDSSASPGVGFLPQAGGRLRR